MRFEPIDKFSGVFSFSLSELIAEYQIPRANGEFPSYICFLLDSLGSWYFTGDVNKRCLDDGLITKEFRAAWAKKVFGKDVDGGEECIENWNKGTRYSVGNYGWDSFNDYVWETAVCIRREYRLSMMRDVLENEGDMEFTIPVWVDRLVRDRI